MMLRILAKRSIISHSCASFRNQIPVAGRRLDLGVTLYTYQLDDRILPYLELSDTVSLWRWRASEMANLEADPELLRVVSKMLENGRFRGFSGRLVRL